MVNPICWIHGNPIWKYNVEIQKGNPIWGIQYVESNMEIQYDIQNGNTVCKSNMEIQYGNPI